MKLLGLFATVDYLGNVPGDACVSVYYHLSSLAFFIVGCEEDETVYTKDLPDNAILVCAGQPEKFFIYLCNLLAKDYFKRLEDSGK